MIDDQDDENACRGCGACEDEPCALECPAAAFDHFGDDFGDEGNGPSLDDRTLDRECDCDGGRIPVACGTCDVATPATLATTSDDAGDGTPATLTATKTAPATLVPDAS